MLFTTSHCITNLIKEKNVKCDKILEAVDVTRESSFLVLQRRNSISLCFCSPSCFVFSSYSFVKENSMADNLDISEDLDFFVPILHLQHQVFTV